MYNSVNTMLAASVVTLALFCTSNTAITPYGRAFERFRGVNACMTVLKLLL